MGTTNELPTYPEDGAKTKSSSRGQREVHAGFQTGIFHLSRTTIYKSANLSEYSSVWFLQFDLERH